MEKPNTTYPKLLMEKAAIYQDRPAMRAKYKGIWQEISWTQYLEKVKFLCLGLLELGMEPGDHASILSENCPEWLFADLAIQSLRGVTVGIYPTNSPDQVKYIVDHSRTRFIVLEDQEQVDKILEVKKELPLLKGIIAIDMKGLRHYDDPLIISYKEVEELGRKAEQKKAGHFEHLVSQTNTEDVAFMVYTSGTTGPPKGCMIQHQNHIYTIRAINDIFKFTEKIRCYLTCLFAISLNGVFLSRFHWYLGTQSTLQNPSTRFKKIFKRYPRPFLWLSRESWKKCTPPFV